MKRFLTRFYRRYAQPLKLAYLEYRYATNGGVKNPDYGFMQAMLDLFTPADFERYESRLALSDIILMQSRNIGHTVNLITHALESIQRRELVDTKRFTEDIGLVGLDDWLTIADGYYIAPQEAIEQYQFQMGLLIKHVLKDCMKPSVDDPHGTNIANKRLLRPFMMSQQQIILALVKLSHQCLKQP